MITCILINLHIHKTYSCVDMQVVYTTSFIFLFSLHLTFLATEPATSEGEAMESPETTSSSPSDDKEDQEHQEL